MSQQRIVRIATAVLVLGLAGLGLLLSLFSVWGAFMVELPGLSPMAMLFDALLSVISKLGLAAVGVALLLRVRSISWWILGALGISMVDTLFYWVAIVPQQMQLHAGPQAAGFLVGAGIVSVLSVVLYLGLLLLVRLPWMREELGRSPGPGPSVATPASAPPLGAGVQPPGLSTAARPPSYADPPGPPEPRASGPPVRAADPWASHDETEG